MAKRPQAKTSDSDSSAQGASSSRVAQTNTVGLDITVDIDSQSDSISQDGSEPQLLSVQIHDNDTQVISGDAQPSSSHRKEAISQITEWALNAKTSTESQSNSHQNSSSSLLTIIEGTRCRVCLEQVTQAQLQAKEAFPLQCVCQGDLAIMHTECGKKWFEHKQSRSCEVCGTEAKGLQALDLDIDSHNDAESLTDSDISFTNLFSQRNRFRYCFGMAFFMSLITVSVQELFVDIQDSSRAWYFSFIINYIFNVIGQSVAMDKIRPSMFVSNASQHRRPGLWRLVLINFALASFWINIYDDDEITHDQFCIIIACMEVIILLAQIVACIVVKGVLWLANRAQGQQVTDEEVALRTEEAV